MMKISEEEARKELEDSILEEILKPIMNWLNKVLKGENDKRREDYKTP